MAIRLTIVRDLFKKLVPRKKSKKPKKVSRPTQPVRPSQSRQV